MALEAGVTQQDLFGCSSKEIYNMYEYGFGMEANLQNEDSENWFDILETQTGHYWDSTILSHIPPPLLIPPTVSFKDPITPDTTTVDVPPTKLRRRRQRNKKSKEEIEKQRMTHIKVERNRRKQMNIYLSSLQQLMPGSYVQRGDQASIIGGAINYVKELEQRLQFLDREKNMNREPVDYHTGSSSLGNSPGSTADSGLMDGELLLDDDDVVEVSAVENHANLRIRSRRRPKQLLKMVSGLQKLRFSILHLNVTTVNKTVVLYTFTVKIDDNSPMSKISEDELASVVSQILYSRIDRDDQEAAIV